MKSKYFVSHIKHNFCLKCGNVRGLSVLVMSSTAFTAFVVIPPAIHPTPNRIINVDNDTKSDTPVQLAHGVWLM